jgi:flagellar basal-body rod protein FlgG
MQQTGNPLDLAIEGNGFFTVMQLNGEPAYTRAGTLKLDAQGRITTSDGLPIQPPITVPSNATSVTIGSDGTVSAVEPNQKTPATLGQIQLTTFPNPDGFNDLGHNLFEATAASGQPVTGVPGIDGRGTILQGATEASNVEVVNEMVSLIAAQRGYEINSKVVAAADEMLRDATQMQS